MVFSLSSGSRIAILLGTLATMGTAQVPAARDILGLSPIEQEQFVNETIAAGFPESRSDQMTMLVLNRSSLVLPPIEKGLKRELLLESPSENRIATAAEMIAYAGDEVALQAIARLMVLDQNRFGRLISRTLDNSLDRGNPFTLAYAGLRIEDARVTVRIVEWCELALSADRMKRLWANAMLERLGRVPNSDDWRGDPLASRLKDSEDGPLRRAVMRFAERALPKQ